ncbi:hypothetical protein [Poriferisphaera corsica]|nr:hypothetical protein [Poriferisphaera corsica]
MNEKLRKWVWKINELSMRAKVVVVCVLLVMGALWVSAMMRPGEPELRMATGYEQAMAGRVMELLEKDKDGAFIARVDVGAEGNEGGSGNGMGGDGGWVYGVDVGMLLQYAAVAENEAMYLALRKMVVEHLIVSGDAVEGFGEGREMDFVAWRYPTKRTIEINEKRWERWGRLNASVEPIDATGTTEALRVAEGLWMGGFVFKRQEDKNLAVRVLRGYAAHAYVDQGVWMIRNYINLQTGAGATNSYTIDYDPDFVWTVANAVSDEMLLDVARRSRGLMLDARSEGGLIHSLVQPEIVTLMDPLPGPIFSPGGVEQINNVVSVAERCGLTVREVAKGVLDFCMGDLKSLRKYYDAKTGKRVGKRGVGRPGIGTYAPLLRLAMRLDERGAYKRILPRLLWEVRGIVRKLEVRGVRAIEGGDDGVSIYEIGEALLSLRLGAIYYAVGDSRVMLPGYVGRVERMEDEVEKIEGQGKKDNGEEKKVKEDKEEEQEMILPEKVSEAD